MARALSKGAIMTRNIIVISLVAAAALAGCNNENPLSSGEDSGNANAVDAGRPSAAVAASKIYRCGDNSVVFVDWLADNKSRQHSHRGERDADPGRRRGARQADDRQRLFR